MNNKQKFSEFCEQWQQHAYDVAIRLTKDPIKAQDLAQDGFVLAHNGWKNYKPENPKAWLARIIHNKFLDRYRKETRRRKVNESLPEGFEASQSVGPDVYINQSVDFLESLIDSIPHDGWKMAFRLKKIEGYTYKEVSEMLGVTGGTCRSHVTYAQKYLRKKLEEIKYFELKDLNGYPLHP